MIKSKFMLAAFTDRMWKVLTICLFILSCEPPSPEIDISNSNSTLSVQRFEQDLFISENELSQDEVEKLKENYGEFYKLFVEKIISVGRAEDSTTTYYLNHFKMDPQVSQVAEVTLNKFSDLEKVQTELSNGFARFNTCFPEKTIPQVYTFISAFSYTLIVDDNLLGIGLDMYLGEDETYYQRLGIPAYRIRRMNASNISTDCMRAWISTEFELPAKSDDLISHMVYHGKILYALDLLLPNVPDSIKAGYSAQQMNWVEENEKDMWFHLADKELFFNKDAKQINKYIGEAPFTPGFPEGSPGMAGRWIGWQIVKKYMEDQDPLDLISLFNEDDAHKILTTSKYKPN